MKTIFLHGLGQTCSSWEKTTAFLKKGADVLCPNLFDWFEGQTANYPVLYRAFSEYCQQFPEPVLCGEKDTVNRSSSLGLQARLPKAEFRLLKNSGHEANLDAPEALAQELSAFFQL